LQPPNPTPGKERPAAKTLNPTPDKVWSVYYAEDLTSDKDGNSNNNNNNNNNDDEEVDHNETIQTTASEEEANTEFIANIMQEIPSMATDTNVVSLVDSPKAPPPSRQRPLVINDANVVLQLIHADLEKEEAAKEQNSNNNNNNNDDDDDNNSNNNFSQESRLTMSSVDSQVMDVTLGTEVAPTISIAQELVETLQKKMQKEPRKRAPRARVTNPTTADELDKQREKAEKKKEAEERKRKRAEEKQEKEVLERMKKKKEQEKERQQQQQQQTIQRFYSNKRAASDQRRRNLMSDYEVGEGSGVTTSATTESPQPSQRSNLRQTPDKVASRMAEKCTE
jgi:hypothetical protein